MTLLGLLVVAIWIGLALTGFWTCRERDTFAPLAGPMSGPRWSPWSPRATRPM
jgi:hypothetical protein